MKLNAADGYLMMGFYDPAATTGDPTLTKSCHFRAFGGSLRLYEAGVDVFPSAGYSIGEDDTVWHSFVIRLDAAGGAVALVGDGPLRDPAEVLAREGPAWLLTSVVYPGNAGSAIRTAEVSGAAGVFLDTDFDHIKRRGAVRASMRADRFFPVLWMTSDDVIRAARDAGRRVIGVEDVGAKPPWAATLSGRVLFVVGGEAEGIPAPILERCDSVVRIPMAGFLRTYNLQAAVAILAAERMRQLEELEELEEQSP